MVDHIEKWKLNELVQVIDEFDSAICDKANESKLKFFHDYKSLLFFMAGKSVVTTKEIICLVQCGYPEGALSLARNLYEQFVIAEFFHTHKADGNFQDYIDDFFADYEIQQNKLLAFSAEYVENDIAAKQQAVRRTTEIRANAHSQKKSPYWWADKGTFSDMAMDLIKRQTNPDLKKFTAMHHMMYQRACVSLHASCAGNMLRLGDDPEFCGVDNRPRKNGHSIPLLLGVYSLLGVTHIVCEEFGIDSTDWKLRLNDLLIYYKSLPEGDKNV
ncbi:MAG: hypothetical protein HFG52_01690 [Lachnospiraceae bacterium]|nr:hypothetical protein [Lachnospiraceae bacterium]